MSFSVYTISIGNSRRKIYAKYIDGIVNQVEYPENISQAEYNELREFIPHHEDKIELEIPMYILCPKSVKIVFGKPALRTIKEKLILFNQAFKHYRKTSYTARQTEKANLKNVPVNTAFLTVFFESELTNYTIDNYVHRINIIKDWATNGRPGQNATRFPDQWNRDYDKRLDDKERVAYHRNLISKGWQKKYSPSTGTYFVESHKSIS